MAGEGEGGERWEAVVVRGEFIWMGRGWAVVSERPWRRVRGKRKRKEGEDKLEEGDGAEPRRESEFLVPFLPRSPSPFSGHGLSRAPAAIRLRPLQRCECAGACLATVDSACVAVRRG